ncbi:GerAB/ArcD/ProY family transporter [Alkalicoccobacillus plakortidis]|uniref:Spore germination protein n=1 Tax=Alkalicoccobacillus plakortidis TaxID=444060 RepID=A0ABT0XF39_9BACI|nr:GerAB/ArcD/ProY family transporter [Alkalicoccobacillus plakortidis]MCM2674513.1 spore germination protein [Alkalicoccobacillus plakortidis]
MKQEFDSISTYQLTILIINCMLGVGFLVLPRRITVTLDSPDGWISLLISGLIILFAVLLLFYFFSKHKVKDIVEYTELAFGKWMSKFICILLVLYFISLTGYEAVAMSEMVRFFLLETTPQMLVVSIILVLAAYLGSSPINTLVRVCMFFLPFCLVVVFFIFLSGLKEVNINNLRPVLESGFNPFVKGFFSTSLSYLGLESLLIFTAFTSAKTKKVKAAVIGIGSTSVLYALTYIIVVGALSYQEVKTLTWPTISFIQTFSIHGIFLERLDSFLLSTWILQFFTICAINTFNICYILEKTFSLKPLTSCFIIVPLAFLVAYIPSDSTEIFLLANFVDRGGLICLIVLPLICFITVSIKKKVIS